MHTFLILVVFLCFLTDVANMCPMFACDGFKPEGSFGMRIPEANMENCKRYNQYEKCIEDHSGWLDGDCDILKNFAYRAECDRLGFRSNSPSSPLTAVYIVAIFNIIVLYSFL